MALSFKKLIVQLAKENLNFQKPYYGYKGDSKRKEDELVTQSYEEQRSLFRRLCDLIKD